MTMNRAWYPTCDGCGDPGPISVFSAADARTLVEAPRDRDGMPSGEAEDYDWAYVRRQAISAEVRLFNETTPLSFVDICPNCRQRFAL